MLPLARHQLVLDELAHLAVEGRQRGLVLGKAALLGLEELLNRHGVAKEDEGSESARLDGGNAPESADTGLQRRHVPLVSGGQAEEPLGVVRKPAVQRVTGVLAGEDRGELDAEESVEALGRWRRLLHDVFFPRARDACLSRPP